MHHTAAFTTNEFLLAPPAAATVAHDHRKPSHEEKNDKDHKSGASVHEITRFVDFFQYHKIALRNHIVDHFLLLYTIKRVSKINELKNSSKIKKSLKLIIHKFLNKIQDKFCLL